MKKIFVIGLVCLFSLPVQAATLITYSFNGIIDSIDNRNAVNALSAFGGFIGQSANVTLSVRSDTTPDPSSNGTAVRYTLENASYSFHTMGGTFDGTIYINDSPTSDTFNVSDQTTPTSTSGVPAGFEIYKPRLSLYDPTAAAINDLLPLQLLQFSDFQYLTMELSLRELISDEYPKLIAIMNDVSVTETVISAVPLPATFWLYGAGIALLGFVGNRKHKKNKLRFA